MNVIGQIIKSMEQKKYGMEMVFFYTQIHMLMGNFKTERMKG
jgi:hypothetical protein